MTTAEHEPGDADGVYAELSYVSPHSRINRRYVAPGREVNTGTYETHRVFVRNGRTAKQEFSLDAHGFTLARHRSEVEDFRDRAQVDATYTQEVEELIRRLTGADLVASIGWMVRVAGPLVPGAQPPASEVHVDMTHASAHRRARRLFEQSFPKRKGFSRFIATSLWRAISPPPQDWPLALCDARSVEDSEGVPNLMLVVDAIPPLEALADEVPDAESLPAASIFHYSRRHAWWYFPAMTRDEVILLKLHDSDHSRAWRAPHTAFRDPGVAGAVPRESIEFRTIAYFM